MVKTERDGRTDGQNRDARTDAHQKFEASYTKALKGNNNSSRQIVRKGSLIHPSLRSTPISFRHASVLSTVGIVIAVRP